MNTFKDWLGNMLPESADHAMAIINDIKKPGDRMAYQVFCDYIADIGMDEVAVNAIRVNVNWLVNACDLCTWTPGDWCRPSNQVLYMQAAVSKWPEFRQRPRPYVKAAKAFESAGLAKYGEFLVNAFHARALANFTANMSKMTAAAYRFDEVANTNSHQAVVHADRTRRLVIATIAVCEAVSLSTLPATEDILRRFYTSLSNDDLYGQMRRAHPSAGLQEAWEDLCGGVGFTAVMSDLRSYLFTWGK